MGAVIALIAASALPAHPATPPANYNAFGIGVFQKIAAHEHGNAFVSPASIGVALSMVADGAAGATRSEILHALQLRDTSGAQGFIADLSANTDARIGMANAIWTRSDIPPAPAYVGLLKDRYAATAQNLRFGDPSAAQTINAWTKAHTLGYIDRIIGDTDPMDFAYLTNALSFDAKWTLPFKRADTRPMPFTSESGTKHDVPMMTQTASFQSVDAGSYRALRLPYGHGGYAAYVLLPKDIHGLNALIAKLSASEFTRLAATTQPSATAVSLPKFTVSFKTMLNPTLQALGIHAAFAGAADFSPMHKSVHLDISKVEHQTYVRVDEAGTVAAAATSVEMRLLSIRVPSQTFVVDHPFVFALRDERSGNLLFIGAVREL